MDHKSFCIRVLTSCACILLAAQFAHAQAGQDSTSYLTIQCMKSTSHDYVKVEREIWQPMHQEMVNQGKKASWALWGVLFGSLDKCDYYTVNRYFGSEAIENDFSDLPAVFSKVHPGEDFGAAMARTDASRKLVNQELWFTLDAVPPQRFKYAQVNRMLAGDGNAYVNSERNIFKPVHEALVKDGLSDGWLLFALARPSGSAVGYNYSTVDLTEHLDPLPFGKYMAEVHPDSDMTKIWQETMSLRDRVSSETLYLIARTKEPVMNEN